MKERKKLTEVYRGKPEEEKGKKLLTKEEIQAIALKKANSINQAEKEKETDKGKELRKMKYKGVKLNDVINKSNNDVMKMNKNELMEEVEYLRRNLKNRKTRIDKKVEKEPDENWRKQMTAYKQMEGLLDTVTPESIGESNLNKLRFFRNQMVNELNKVTTTNTGLEKWRKNTIRAIKNEMKKSNIKANIRIEDFKGIFGIMRELEAHNGIQRGLDSYDSDQYLRVAIETYIQQGRKEVTGQEIINQMQKKLTQYQESAIEQKLAEEEEERQRLEKLRETDPEKYKRLMYGEEETLPF